VLQVTVYIRVVFLKIGEIDTLKENFMADAFIQARWREPALDGQASQVCRGCRAARVATCNMAATLDEISFHKLYY